MGKKPQLIREYMLSILRYLKKRDAALEKLLKYFKVPIVLF